jgi:hypothetical protein
LVNEETRLSRIIPFQYRDEAGQWHRIPFPEELGVEKSVENWEEEFSMQEMFLGPFLAEQITRRVQALVSTDERILNTFHQAKLTFEYSETPPPPHFSLDVEAALKDLNNYSKESLVFHEDMLYLLNIASREFVTVLRSYHFGHFDYLSLRISQEPAPRILGREALELFRRNKADLHGLLSIPQI